MVFHPIRLALIVAICSVLGIGGAGAKSPARTAPATHEGALVACLETAAGNPTLFQICVDRAHVRPR
jgi:hypothetical protein